MGSWWQQKTWNVISLLQNMNLYIVKWRKVTLCMRSFYFASLPLARASRSPLRLATRRDSFKANMRNILSKHVTIRYIGLLHGVWDRLVVSVSNIYICMYICIYLERFMANKCNDCKSHHIYFDSANYDEFNNTA